MLVKKELKDIQSLSHKKHRDESGAFVAEGPKIIAEFLELIPERLQKIYATEDWVKEHLQKTSNIAVQTVSENELQKLSGLQTPNEVVAVVKQFPVTAPKKGEGFVLYLDTIQDPGNFGTIIRLADWFGIQQIVCTPGCADLYNPKVVQATMASMARVSIGYDESLDWLEHQDVPVLAATLDGRSVYDYPKINSGVMIIGNESKGVRPELLNLATERLTIPKKGKAESLNAAVATGIILSHLLS